jgi:hypothetical protein
MPRRKPQNVGRKIARLVEENRQEPRPPNPAHQRQSAFKRSRAAAQERLKDEVIFPEDELTAESCGDISANAVERVKINCQKIK